MAEREPYMEWQIEECIECLERSARKIGDTHSQIMEAKGRGSTPFAYQSTNSWHAIEIIRELQAEIERLKNE
jgi:mevalonate pyrophosphate decarboxylase